MPTCLEIYPLQILWSEEAMTTITIDEALLELAEAEVSCADQGRSDCQGRGPLTHTPHCNGGCKGTGSVAQYEWARVKPCLSPLLHIEDGGPPLNAAREESRCKVFSFPFTNARKELLLAHENCLGYRPITLAEAKTQLDEILYFEYVNINWLGDEGGHELPYATLAHHPEIEGKWGSNPTEAAIRTVHAAMKEK